MIFVITCIEEYKNCNSEQLKKKMNKKNIMRNNSQFFLFISVLQRVNKNFTMFATICKYNYLIFNIKFPLKLFIRI